MLTIIVSNFTLQGIEICWRIVIILKVLRLIYMLCYQSAKFRIPGEICIKQCTNLCCCPCFQNLRRGIVTLKVRRNSPGAPSLSAFTTPRSTPGSSRRNSKDVTAESSSSSNSSSPTMFRKLRQKRSQKEKKSEIVLYKGRTLNLCYV